MTDNDHTNNETASAHPLRAAADHLAEVAERPGVAQMSGPKFALAAIRTVNHGFFTSAQATTFLNAAADSLEELGASGWPEVAT